MAYKSNMKSRNYNLPYIWACPVIIVVAIIAFLLVCYFEDASVWFYLIFIVLSAAAISVGGYLGIKSRENDFAGRKSNLNSKYLELSSNNNTRNGTGADAETKSREPVSENESSETNIDEIK